VFVLRLNVDSVAITAIELTGNQNVDTFIELIADIMMQNQPMLM
jgi:hypothetical protein